MSDKPRESYQFKVGKYSIIVDYSMVPFLAIYTWHVKQDKQTYYAYTNIHINKGTTRVSMHRLLTGMRNCQVDHKNRNGLDNRLENLRHVSAKQNSWNRVRENKYGYRGVFRPKGSPNFAFQIQANGKRIARYGFATPYAAAKAYDKENRRMHGEYGIRNFKD